MKSEVDVIDDLSEIPSEEVRLFDDISADIHDATPIQFSRHDNANAVSFWRLAGGLLGLGLAFLVTCIVMALGFAWTDRNTSLIGRMISEQLFCVPALAVSSVIVATCFFWRGSIFLRCVASIILLAPGLNAFGAVSRLLSRFPIWEIQFGFFDALFAFVAMAAVPGMLGQLWSPWRLSVSEQSDSDSARWGIRLLLELTVIVAAFDVAARAFAQVGLIPPVLVAGAFGAVSGLLAWYAAVVLLAEKVRYRKLIVLALAVWAMACARVALQYEVEFGAGEIRHVVDKIAIVAIGGLVAYSTTIVCCVLWLRKCGWSCEPKRNKDAIER